MPYAVSPTIIQFNHSADVHQLTCAVSTMALRITQAVAVTAILWACVAAEGKPQVDNQLGREPPALGKLGQYNFGYHVGVAVTEESRDRPSEGGARAGLGRAVQPGQRARATLIAPQRHPKPKKPMGNDIGVARLLDHTTAASNETKTVDKELGQVFEAMPALPQLKLQTNDTTEALPFDKDPEEESLDARITEVARQLAETSLRQQYEERKLGHNIPITLKSGKSFEFPVQTLPLVSRLPPENAQLQLITEVQSIPQHIYKEGFYPVTPAPELSGPLLGGPPLKPRTRSIQGDGPARPVAKNLDLFPALYSMQGYLLEAPPYPYPVLVNLAGAQARMVPVLDGVEGVFVPHRV